MAWVFVLAKRLKMNALQVLFTVFVQIATSISSSRLLKSSLVSPWKWPSTVFGGCVETRCWEKLAGFCLHSGTWDPTRWKKCRTRFLSKETRKAAARRKNTFIMFYCQYRNESTPVANQSSIHSLDLKMRESSLHIKFFWTFYFLDNFCLWPSCDFLPGSIFRESIRKTQPFA